ncbi:hypothetical protein GQ57_10745 [Burkholderia sp. MSh2]|nr:hypothetical protein GQ57_10745 [Burkholderia sp. MSh2]
MGREFPLKCAVRDLHRIEVQRFAYLSFAGCFGDERHSECRRAWYRMSAIDADEMRLAPG